MNSTFWFFQDQFATLNIAESKLYTPLTPITPKAVNSSIKRFLTLVVLKTDFIHDFFVTNRPMDDPCRSE